MKRTQNFSDNTSQEYSLKRPHNEDRHLLKNPRENLGN